MLFFYKMYETEVEHFPSYGRSNDYGYMAQQY